MLSMFGRLPRVLVANWDFAGWQLAWAAHGSKPTQSLGSAVHPVRESLLDFGLIAAYSYLLAFGFTWAFARDAQLSVAMKRNWLLNMSGMGACIAVLADLAKNGWELGLLLIYPNTYLPGLEIVLGLLMSAAALAKWAGLAGSSALVVWACISTLLIRSRDLAIRGAEVNRK